MPETTPAKLYWYRSLAGDRKKWAEELVVDSKIYLAAPQDYNDPFEFYLRFSFNAPRERKVDFFKSKFIEQGREEGEAEREAQFMANPGPLLDHEHEAHMEKTLAIPFIEQFRRSTGVLSLTELDRHPLMWAHYADAHRGICLQFDTTVEAGANRFADALRVNYQTDFPILRFFYDSDEERARAAAFTKSDHWRYEKEWRVVVVNAAGKKIPFPPQALTGITLGARISSTDEAEVREWVRQLGHPVELRKARPAKDRYALEIEVLQA